MKALTNPKRCSFNGSGRQSRRVFGGSCLGANGTKCKAQLNELQGCKLVGTGSSAPSQILTNHDLEKLVETNDEWIFSRTGIRQRRILGKGETITQHAQTAGLNALEMAGIKAEDLDVVLLCTSTPDDVFGGACAIQAAIGAKNAIAFDVTAACSGFVVGLVTAAQYIRCGTFKNILVIGADAMSRLVDWNDRGTCILFGDGCGALVVTANPDKGCSLLGKQGTKSRRCQQTCQYNALCTANKGVRWTVAYLYSSSGFVGRSFGRRSPV